MNKYIDLPELKYIFIYSITDGLVFKKTRASKVASSQILEKFYEELQRHNDKQDSVRLLIVQSFKNSPTEAFPAEGLDLLQGKKPIMDFLLKLNDSYMRIDFLNFYSSRAKKGTNLGHSKSELFEYESRGSNKEKEQKIKILPHDQSISVESLLRIASGQDQIAIVSSNSFLLLNLSLIN